MYFAVVCVCFIACKWYMVFLKGAFITHQMNLCGKFLKFIYLLCGETGVVCLCPICHPPLPFYITLPLSCPISHFNSSKNCTDIQEVTSVFLDLHAIVNLNLYARHNG